MKEIVRYTGPYTFPMNNSKVAGRKFMVVTYSDGSQGTVLYQKI